MAFSYGAKMRSINDNKDPYTMAAQEDRSAPRTVVSTPATLRPSGARSFKTVIRDISLSGFSALAINPMERGTLCWLTVPGCDPLEARVVWWCNNVAGCEFQQLLNEEEFEFFTSPHSRRSGGFLL